MKIIFEGSDKVDIEATYKCKDCNKKISRHDINLSMGESNKIICSNCKSVDIIPTLFFKGTVDIEYSLSNGSIIKTNAFIQLETIKEN